MSIVSEAKIPGKAVASSIEMMAALGPIGERVLREQGIDVIDPEKKYSYSIRTAIFDEVCNRFGNEALTAFGIENYVYYSEFVNFSKSFRHQNESHLNDPTNHKNNIKLLEKLMPQVGDMLDEVVRENFKSETTSGSVRVNQISPAVFELNTITALHIDHHTFIRGAWRSILLECVADIFDVDFEFIPDRSRSLEGGWVNFVFIVRFTPHAELRNPVEITAEERFKANDKLLRSVLLDAERQKEQIENLSLQLGKYLPPQIHKALFAGNYDTGITTRRKKLTIFFSDIKNFTSTSEGLQPEDLTNYLNEYFSEMTEIALDCGATIDKYIGDAMMVFFGDPESGGEREDARACVAMALRMQKRMLYLQKKWQNQGFANPFQIRMGMNTGYCNVGNFGSDQRLTYTIIGGEVNIAQRLESAADAGGILMSYETYAHAQDLVDVEELDSITMKGINRKIKVFSVKEARSDSKSMVGDTKEIPLKVEEANVIEKRLVDLEKEILAIRHHMLKGGKDHV